MTSTELGLLNRDARQRDLVPPDRLAGCHAAVVGVGAIGRQVALQLASTGVAALTLYDPDVVRAENLAPQGFWESELDAPKVEAVAAVCQRQFPRIRLDMRPERFRRSAVRDWPAGRQTALFC